MSEFPHSRSDTVDAEIILHSRDQPLQFGDHLRVRGEHVRRFSNVRFQIVQLGLELFVSSVVNMSHRNLQFPIAIPNCVESQSIEVIVRVMRRFGVSLSCQNRPEINAMTKAVEQIVSELKTRSARESVVPLPFASREEWRKAIREWASGHSVGETSADWGRESVYAGCGE